MIQVIVLEDPEENVRLQRIISEMTAQGISASGFFDITDLGPYESSNCYVFHGNNPGVWEYVERTLMQTEHQFVIFTGGSYKEHLEEYYDEYGGYWWNGDNETNNIASPFYVEGVNEDNVTLLVKATRFLLTKLESNSLSSDIDIPRPKSNLVSEFEKRRRDISHDGFKNSFCNALGFEASIDTSLRRYELFQRAARDREVWLKMKRVSIKWQDIASDLRHLLEDVKKEPSFAYPMTSYKKLSSASLNEIELISKLMKKFSGDSYRKSVLTACEIEQFWHATDTIRELLSALSPNDIGPINLNYFETKK